MTACSFYFISFRYNKTPFVLYSSYKKEYPLPNWL